ncbi:EAL domain-containing response regulator [Leptospira limi]|uniref:EAL domain-containing response regulator n=1 Tax=Leptospira limi TaxID=2950023 RepID=A0ABT3LXC8_9LEPT|nr:EAL domain-containing response regulator [Leptospira limi]MCW7462140.1 EAL domain-containing response regulator [Leptospira limi]
MNTVNKRVTKALILDDNLEMTSFLSEVLQDANISEIISLTESTKLYKIYNDSIDLIVLDLFMPDMDGIEILRFLGEKKSKASIILMSGYNQAVLSSAERIAKAYGLNVIGTVSKPINMETILILIENRNKTLNHFQNDNSKELLFTKEEILIGIKNRELVLYYQPQIHLQSKKLIGFEALVRWNHPTHGIIFPDQFLPVLAKHNLSAELTKYLIAEACSFFGLLNKTGFRYRVSINISVFDLIDSSLPDAMLKLIEKNNLNPNQIVLELVEIGKIDNAPQKLEILTRICMKGIGLSIDDFGTGYSSLDQLTKAPFSELKIDKGFVFNLLKNENSLKIIESTVHLSKKLKMDIVAEGIENKETRNLLQNLGIEIGQGYYFSLPLPEANVIQYINDFKYEEVDVLN